MSIGSNAGLWYIPTCWTTVGTFTINGTATVTNSSWFYSMFEAPLDVACPKCKASSGIKCFLDNKYSKRWKKGRQHQAWYGFKTGSGPTPHPERIKESKIQAVIRKLDGEC